MNKIILIGRTTKEPEIRYGQNEEEKFVVARFTLAVQRSYKRDSTDDADFINCAAFGKTAEFVEKYVKKGTKLAVEGEWRSGSYIGKDGTRVYTDTCNVRNLEFCESKKADSARETEAGNDFMDIPDDMDDELPFN